MPDEIVAKDNGQRFEPHPEGQFAAVCVDTIDLGLRVNVFAGETKITPKCAVVFRTGRTNEQNVPYDINQEFTVSMFDRANLRLFLESWRGKTYTDVQAQSGVVLHKLVGHGGLIQVEHKTSAKGRVYAVIKSIMPLPDGMVLPTLKPEYVRPDYWAEKKTLYADELAAYKVAHAPAPTGVNTEGEDDDELPF